jgi:hypothetical protein
VGVALAVVIAARCAPDHRWAGWPVAALKRWLPARAPSQPPFTDAT